jgi:hypothetical protein
VSRTDSYVPKHRGAPAEPKLKRRVRRGVVVSGFAVAATGTAVAGGVVLAGDEPPAQAALAGASLLGSADAAESGDSAASDEAARQALLESRDRRVSVSRSDQRPEVDRAKARALSQESGGQVTRTEDLASGDPRDVARAMLAEFGWSQDQFGCLDSLWSRESGWNPRAANPSSSAYGIPQALPGSKMASAGPDWEYNPETQIRWGLGYIQGRYGSPCGAWGHSQAAGWY